MIYKVINRKYNDEANVSNMKMRILWEKNGKKLDKKSKTKKGGPKSTK